MCAASPNPDADPAAGSGLTSEPEIGAAPPPRAAAETAPNARGAPQPRFLRRRRAEAAAAVLPLLALFALMPPFIGVFAHDGRTFGAPSILAFLLAVWLGLILITRRLARSLSGRDEPL
ncbi:MAG: hypothetical protein AAF763_01860 [Pseudomonadota bacterium]